MKIYNTLLLGMAAISLIGCDDSLDASLPSTKVIVELELADGVSKDDITNPRVTFKNVSNGTESEFALTPDSEICVLPGLYNISYEADCYLESGAKSTLKANKTSVIIQGSEMKVNLSTFNIAANDDFVIAEVFFTGTLQSSGNQYYGDDYIKIYNNTDHVLYADGLTFFESKFLTTEKYDYSPDIMSEAMTVQALYTIPGTGKDYPVEPGEFLLLADTGIDHRVINPNSFDLSTADFEWYDISSKPSHMDIDSPTVPNLDKWYCYTLSFFVLHNRGFRAYGLARIPVEKEKYLKEYRYTYDYTIIVDAGTFPMSQSAYKIPNEWILDVVNTSVEAKYKWNICAPSLDMGWTSCGTIDHDKTRYFHSVRRKVASLNDDGSPILQDTNNSTKDFNAFMIPSEIELQGTAVDIYGTPCTTLTYDGVLPMSPEVAARYRKNK
ncbi:MAG: DUF4876 domain-containing protein [Clostridium sp.]|nr:DUF4876 domain-containing protein [Prevotella sp.]MCM1429442.1 DUF4876 domain-containing protein [Clostridium sp.]